MNWYVLFVLKQYEDGLCSFLNQKNISVFSAKYEHYRRDKKCLEIKSLFPGYLFVKTELSSQEIKDHLSKLENKKGLICQLQYQDVSALRKEEIQILDMLLDKEGILRASKAHLENKKLVIEEGPLKGLDDYIVKYDKRNKEAYLDLFFIKQQWKATVLD